MAFRQLSWMLPALFLGSVGATACVGDEPAVGTASDGGSDASADTTAAADGGGDASTTTCDAGQTMCGACATTASDPKNCGACGHDCLGGACSAGSCQSFAIHTSLGTGTPDDYNVMGVAVDATSIYWTSGGAGKVFKCPLTGCGASGLTVLAAPPFDAGYASVSTILENGGKVFFADAMDNVVWRVDADGSNLAPFAYDMQAGGLAVDTMFHWLVFGGGKIARANIADGTGPMDLATGGSGYIGGLAVANGTAFYADPQAGRIAACNDDLGCGTTPVVVAPAQASPFAIVVANGTLFWTNQVGGTGAVMTSPATPPYAPAAFASNQDSASGLAADATTLYWEAGGGIFKCPLTGCPAAGPTKIARVVVALPDGGANPNIARALATDTKAVYWGDQTGNIMAIAK